jgi:hypothetical protein
MFKNSRVDHNINFGMFYPDMFRAGSGSSENGSGSDFFGGAALLMKLEPF